LERFTQGLLDAGHTSEVARGAPAMTPSPGPRPRP